ncbi:hypothetical protein A2767_03810 [Candidatus Roizmanbacteria bacterium RIFCSPHIGHO2_01_FULL_35_10]|uniref:Antitoxin n=1 Tax=Candidatus Roizmanbacteria bacterium RIFCSPLOWO2_01_FULL_35_13 TaxID=1802055 RepID=A0A1F7IA71_9BACT|nr:MAG: hypothetical protein A2767_03810 [Candidatus Roizmanbacteria bacterium RIFCSPHIGHO2_01_FULL_35_10]OGK40250.1 MAG: hypothetical protein A3A74_07125 [Candidatus Roizmanbacteria bacterium RIFCSPLOWO2_01_FULL_35_13]
MDIKTTLPITEVRKKLFNIVDEVEKRRTRFIVTEKGRPKAVIMSAEEFESMRETLDVLIENPDLPKIIEETEEDFKTGKYKKYPTLEEVLEEDGYLVKDKSNKKYEVRNKSKG